MAQLAQADKAEAAAIGGLRIEKFRVVISMGSPEVAQIGQEQLRADAQLVWSDGSDALGPVKANQQLFPGAQATDKSRAFPGLPGHQPNRLS